MKAYKAECTNSGSRLEPGAFVGKSPVLFPNFCLQSVFGCGWLQSWMLL